MNKNTNEQLQSTTTDVVGLNKLLAGDGASLIRIICNRLNDEGKLLYDSNIINKLRMMTKQELNQALFLGDVIKWHNDRIRE